MLKSMKKRRFFGVLGEYCYFGNTYRVLSKFCKMTFAKQIFKSELAHCLVNYDCDGVGEIELAGVFYHRNADRHIVVVVKKFFGKSSRFSAEEQKVVCAEFCFVVSYACLR